MVSCWGRTAPCPASSIAPLRSLPPVWHGGRTPHCRFQNSFRRWPSPRHLEQWCGVVSREKVKSLSWRTATRRAARRPAASTWRRRRAAAVQHTNSPHPSSLAQPRLLASVWAAERQAALPPLSWLQGMDGAELDTALGAAVCWGGLQEPPLLGTFVAVFRVACVLGCVAGSCDPGLFPVLPAAEPLF